MKKSLLTLGVAAMVTITLNSFAGDALLSPRTAGNQISHVAAVTGAANPVNAAATTVAPRAAGNQVVIAAGTATGAAVTCGKMAGTPKMIAECASHPGAVMPCCATASAK